MMPASSGRDNGRIASASTSQRWRQNRSYAIALLDEWRYFFAQRSDGCVASVRLAHRAPHDSTNALLALRRDREHHCAAAARRVDGVPNRCPGPVGDKGDEFDGERTNQRWLGIR